MHISDFISRLEKVRQGSKQSYSALCPAHEDSQPSLSIREGSDGRILVTCFAGCTIDEICSALEIEVADLFPEKLEHHSQPRPIRMALSDALRMLETEALIVALAAEDAANKGECDRDRLWVALARIEEVRRATRA